MKLFNEQHFPVVDEGTHFDFSCSLPKEELFSIDIQKEDIKIEPVTTHSGVTLLELTDLEKAKMYDILMQVDNIRMLGKKTSMLVSLSDKKPMLFKVEIDNNPAPSSVRGTLCSECNMTDSMVCYNTTLTDFLKKNKLRHYYYDAAVKGQEEPYQFTLSDIAQYSNALKKKTEDTVCGDCRVHYESPINVQERSDLQELADRLNAFADFIEKHFEGAHINNMADLHRLFK